MSKPRTYTAQYVGKWHAGFTIGNQSFVLSAFEGTEEEANWYAAMMDKALAKLRLVKEVDAMCGDHGGIEGCSCSECSAPVMPEAWMFCPGCGNKVKWPK